MTIPEDELIGRLRQGYEAFNRGDYEAATEWVHPDVVFVSPSALTEFRGADALRAWMEPDAFETQVSELREDGDRVMGRLDLRRGWQGHPDRELPRPRGGPGPALLRGRLKHG